MDVEHRGVVRGAGVVVRHAGVGPAVTSAGGGDRQERRARCHFRRQDTEVGRICVLEPVEVPFDVDGQVPFRHVTVELNGLTREHRLVRFERYYVGHHCQWRGRR